MALYITSHVARDHVRILYFSGLQNKWKGIIQFLYICVI